VSTLIASRTGVFPGYAEYPILGSCTWTAVGAVSTTGASENKHKIMKKAYAKPEKAVYAKPEKAKARTSQEKK